MLIYKFLHLLYMEKNMSKISPWTWNGKFKLSHALYYESEFQDCFEEIIKKHERRTDNPTINIHVSKKEIGIIFKIKTWYYLGLLTTERMKLLGSTEKK